MEIRNGWQKRCGELIKIRNNLQKENSKLISAITKVTYLIKSLDQEEIDYELKKFYLFLEKKGWIKPRNTQIVIQNYKIQSN